MGAQTCASWFTPERRQCPQDATDGHRWCQHHQDLATKATEAARKKDVDPDAWRHFRYVQRVDPRHGTPGPSDRERAYRKHLEARQQPAVDPQQPDTWWPPVRVWRPCEACLFEIGNLGSASKDRSWHNLPATHQQAHTGGRPPTWHEEYEYRATIRAIRERCYGEHRAAEEQAA
jgi:hypothetical protein